MKCVMALTLMLVGEAFGQSVRVLVPGTVQVIALSPDGRRAGFSPEENKVVLELPDADYSYGSIGSIDSADDSPPNDYYELFFSESISGSTIRLSVFGVYSCRFYLEFTRYEPFGKVTLRSYVSKGTRTEFLLHLAKTSTSIFRDMTSGSLRRDIETAFEVGELGGRELFNDLYHRAQKYEEAVTNDSAKARRELEKLDEKLDDVYAKSSGKARDPNHFLKPQAYEILKADIEALKK